MARRFRFVAAFGLTLVVLQAEAGERIAIFPAELYTSSPEPVRDDERARLGRLDGQLGRAFADRGYTVVDTAPVAHEIERYAQLWDCNGCELSLAQGLNAELAAVLWVQKVSNLILNLNLKISEASTRQLVRAASVDIRGNTDESWSRGLRHLLDHRIFSE